MIKELVDRFMQNKGKLEEHFRKEMPGDYKEIVKAVVEIITDDEYRTHALDPERIHEIDDGNYQGTLVYVIAEKGYQPSDYYYVGVSYGSCSGCDTLEGIRGYSDEPPNEQQVKDFMTLALHIVQGIKQMGGESC